MPKKKPFIIVSLLLISALFLSIFNCELPPDPDDPSAPSINLVLRAGNWAQDSLSITDTVGNAILIGATLHLPENIDSVGLVIEEDGTVFF